MMMISPITSWAGAVAGGGTKGITLTAPTLKDPGASKAFPTSPALFSTTVHPVLKEYCARCHTSSAAAAQSPYFASNDVDEAYAAVKVKMNLDQPAQSRLVLRLRNEFHNCWSDCAANATEMETAIGALASQVAKIDWTLNGDPAAFVESIQQRFDPAKMAAIGAQTPEEVEAFAEALRRRAAAPPPIDRPRP